MENHPAKKEFRLPVELIAEVAHWLHDGECAELDPVSKQFDSFTRGRALEWIHMVSIKYWETCKGCNSYTKN